MTVFPDRGERYLFEKFWNTKSIKGIVNFLKKVYLLIDNVQEKVKSEENNKLIQIIFQAQFQKVYVKLEI